MRAYIRQIILGILVGLYFYLAWSLFGPFPHWGARILGALGLLSVYVAIFYLFLVLWAREDDESRWYEWIVQWFAFCGMGLFSFVLILSILRDVLYVIGVHHLRTPMITFDLLAAATVLFFSGVLIANFRVAIKTTLVPIDGLAKELVGLRIAQISDLHIGSMIRQSFVQKVVDLVNSTRPDVIVLTGDIADGMVKDLASEAEPLRGLSATLGKFYIPGNHEYYWEAQPWMEHFRSLGLTPLPNENRVLIKEGASFVVAGVNDPTAAEMGKAGTESAAAPDFVRALSGAPETARPRIILCHQPQLAKHAEQAGFDLQLSGHTHGGQFFPWTLVVKLVYDFPHGLHKLGKMGVYVSRGTGYWGPPVRLGAPPEVSLLILERA